MSEDWFITAEEAESNLRKLARETGLTGLYLTIDDTSPTQVPLPTFKVDLDELDQRLFNGWQAIRKQRRARWQRRTVWYRRVLK